MRFDLLVFDGLDELDVLGPLEVLRSAQRLGAPFDVRLVTLQEDLAITGAYGLNFSADQRYEPGADALVVPGGGWVGGAAQGVRAQATSGQWTGPLTDAVGAGVTMVGVCTGTLLLAHAGLVKGRRVSTHHGAREDLARYGAIVLTDRVVDDGDLITSGGVTSGIDLALWLVERFSSAAHADATADRMEYERSRPSLAS